ncbi:MAG TPA: HK97 family phage prohead protease [Micromonosporaceae bacterium]|nr:HK97 family phage prohead protease [Micromonosporaceae bacterium]
MRIKSCPAQIKAAPAADGNAGEFTALVSVFGNVDSYGDVVVHGAFTDTIAEWKASGDRLPVLWSHRMDDPNFNIGAVLDIAELEPGDPRLAGAADPHVAANGGLWVHGVIDTGPDASPIAVQAQRLLKARRVTQFSYAYDIVDAGPATVDGVDAYELRKLKLYEVSPTQVGANELTELLAAKAAGVNGDSNIRGVVDLLTTYLASLDRGTSGSAPAKQRDEPTGAKRGDEPAMPSATSLRLLHDRTALELSVTD